MALSFGRLVCFSFINCCYILQHVVTWSPFYHEQYCRYNEFKAFLFWCDDVLNEWLDVADDIGLI